MDPALPRDERDNWWIILIAVIPVRRGPDLVSRIHGTIFYLRANGEVSTMDHRDNGRRAAR